MIRIIFLLPILIIVSVFAFADQNSTRVLLQANKIYKKSNTIYASGNIRLKYQDVLIRADFANYNKNKDILKIFGSVEIISSDGSIVKTDKIILELDQESIVFEKFLIENLKKIWLSSKMATKKKDCYSVKQATLSSCSLMNPDWHLKFSEAKYSTKTKYIKLKDIKFYVSDIPIFYFPYLSFSLSKDINLNLFLPKFGYSSKDGFLYEQPIYRSIDPNMDIGLSTQIKMRRGGGLYSAFEVIDNNHSKTTVRAGYFVDSQKYTEENNLKHSSHYGIEAMYTSNDILGQYRPSDFRDALYMNIILFNDIDYLNLQKNRIYDLPDFYFKESRINYMLYDLDNYLGLNMRYFIDATKKSNAEILQELPTIRWHQYSSSFTQLQNLSHSIDVSISNYIGKNGFNSKQMVVDMPIKYNLSLLDEYLHLELGEKMFLYNNRYDDTSLGSNNHSVATFTQSIKLYSDLVNIYSRSAHTIQWSMLYEKQYHIGDKFAYNNAEISRDFISDKYFDRKVTFQFGQFWHMYDSKLLLKQNISQVYYPGSDKKWSDLRHEFDIYYGRWSLLNLFDYSYEHNAISEVSNDLSYDVKGMRYSIQHYWRKDLELNKIIANDITFDGTYRYSKMIKLFANITYDLDEQKSKKYSVGIRYNKGCWGVELGYKHDIYPVLETSGNNFAQNNAFFIKINLFSSEESKTRQ